MWNPLRYNNMDRWLGASFFPEEPREPIDPSRPVDIFLAVCDHYEPEFGRPPYEESVARVDRWVERYPAQFGDFADHRGRPPQHTFFFPQDEYRPEYLDRLRNLVDAGYGDVDVHLHHRNDTEDALREKLDVFREDLHHRHGLLRRDPATGEIVYGFIHGNWALCNSRHNGDWCGVDQELTVLQNTGCYADFTLPSAPDETQTPTINSIYYAQDKPGQPASHNTGTRSRVGTPPPDDHLLMIQGPLALNFRSRKYGLLPRTENGDVHGKLPPTLDRLKLWLRISVHVAGEPNRVFLKLHTHGCNPDNERMWFSDRLRQFHAELAGFIAAGEGRYRLHYVTAWEMANLVHATERGESVESVLDPVTHLAG